MSAVFSIRSPLTHACSSLFEINKNPIDVSHRLTEIIDSLERTGMLPVAHTVMLRAAAHHLDDPVGKSAFRELVTNAVRGCGDLEALCREERYEEALKGLENRPIQRATQRAQEFLFHLDKTLDEAIIYFEEQIDGSGGNLKNRFHYKRLHEALVNTPESIRLQKLGELLQSEDVATDFVENVERMIEAESPEREGTSLEVAKRVYNLTALFFRYPPQMTSRIRAAELQGRLNTKWKEYDNLRHIFCGCHFHSDEHTDVVAWPTLHKSVIKRLKKEDGMSHAHPSLKGKTLNAYSCHLGGAHYQVHTALGQMASAETHYHVEDGLDETLRSLDGVRKIFAWIGIEFSATDFYNFFVRHNWCRLLNFIVWLTGGESKAEVGENERELFLESMLKTNPELVCGSYVKHTNSISTAAHSLGLGMYSAATDYDPELTDITAENPAINPHLKHVIWLDRPEERAFLKGALREEQIVEGPPAVRLQCLRSYSDAECSDLRHKHNIAPDDQVLIVNGGGFGLFGHTPSWTLDHLKRLKKENVHVIVLCGHNKRAKKHLETKYADLPKVNFKGFIGGEELRELYAIVAHKNSRGLEGFNIGKLGGGTLSELQIMGVRALVDKSNGLSLPWENHNAKVYLDEGSMGKRFRNQGEFCQNLEALLDCPKHEHLPGHRYDPRIRIPEIMAQIVEETHG